MEKLIRTITPEVKIISSDGQVDYVASDESVDSHREVIRAKGWKFTHFKRNAPFVDSHDYSSVGKLLGKVVDFRVRGGKLVERVQWAVDVPEQPLAQIGWKLTEAGYLKGVSVGFYPLQAVSAFGSDQRLFSQQLKELGLKEGEINRVFLEQEQIELSSVIIGSNPNALAKAYKDDVVREEDLDILAEFRARDHRGSDAKRSKEEFLEEIDKAISNTVKPNDTMTTRHSFIKNLDSLSGTLRSGNATPRQKAHAAMLYQESLSTRTMAARGRGIPAIENDEELCQRFNLYVRLKSSQSNVHKNVKDNFDGSLVRKALGEDSSPGDALITDELLHEIYYAIASHGVWASFGVRQLGSKSNKFPVSTADPIANFILAEGQTIAEDTNKAGTTTNQDAEVVGVLLPVSQQILMDAEADVTRDVLSSFGRAFGLRADTACLTADGTVDATNGGMTGAFEGGTAVTAASGNTTIETLDFEDFTNVLLAVDPGVLTRDARWYMHPHILVRILHVKDSSGRPIFLTASESPVPGAIGTLLGYPVVLSHAAPSSNTAGSKIAVFTEPDAVVAGVRKQFEIEGSGHFDWDTLEESFRGVGRFGAKIRRAEAIGVLTLAAS